MAQFAVLANLQGDNSAGAAAADIVINVANPLPTAPDRIYVIHKANCNGVDTSYDSGTNQIQVTFRQVPAGQIGVADLFVQKEHSIWQGGTFIQAIVNSGANTVSGVEEEPDIVLPMGGDVPDNATWTYDPNTKTVTFNNLAATDAVLMIIKLHSIQHNQNGTTDAGGVLTGQNEKPDILIQKGALVGVSRSTIDANYDATNKQITGLTANTQYVSIPIHSIFA